MRTLGSIRALISSRNQVLAQEGGTCWTSLLPTYHLTVFHIWLSCSFSWRSRKRAVLMMRHTSSLGSCGVAIVKDGQAVPRARLNSLCHLTSTWSHTSSETIPCTTSAHRSCSLPWNTVPPAWEMRSQSKGDDLVGWQSHLPCRRYMVQYLVILFCLAAVCAEKLRHWSAQAMTSSIFRRNIFYVIITVCLFAHKEKAIVHCCRTQKEMSMFTSRYLFCKHTNLVTRSSAGTGAIGIDCMVASVNSSIVVDRGRHLPLGWWHLLRAGWSSVSVCDVQSNPE